MSSNPAIVIGVSAIDTSKQVLAGVDSSIRRTSQTIEQEGNKITSKFAQISANLKANMLGIAQTAAGLGAGIISFSTSFDTLEKAQYRSDKANLTLAKSQEALTEMLESGKASAEELANQQELVALNTERARLSQDDLSDTYRNFLANIPSQLISFGVAANGIYTMLRGHQIAGAVTSKVHGFAYTGALASMAGANGLFAGSIAVVRTALNFLAAHPIILAFMGLATLIILVATNTFGLRDAFFSLGKAIHEFFVQYFKPLADAMSWFYHNVLKPIGDFIAGPSVQSAEAYSESLGDLSMQTDNTTASQQAMYDQMLAQLDAQKDLNIETIAAEQSLGGYVRQIDTYTDSVNNATRATSNLATAKRALDTPGVSYESETGARVTGERAELKEKYGNIPLVKVGGHWRPKALFDAGRNLENAQNWLQAVNFKNTKSGGALATRYRSDELSELEKAQQGVDMARANYAQEMLNLNAHVTINQRKDGTIESADVQVTRARNRQLKASRQVLAGRS